MEKTSEEKNGKFYIQIIGIMLFINLLILPTLFWGILQIAGRRNPSVMERLEVATGENRNPAEIESWELATLTEELETYYNDRIPFRSLLLAYKKKNDNRIEKYYMDSVQPMILSWFSRQKQHETEVVKQLEDGMTGSKLDVEPIAEKETVSAKGKDSGDMDFLAFQEPPDGESRTGEETGNAAEEQGMESGSKEQETDSSESQESWEKKTETENPPTETVQPEVLDETFFPPRIVNDVVIMGRENWLFYAGENSIDYYCGSNPMSSGKMEELLCCMQQLQDACDSRGILLQFLIVPNKEQVYSEYMPTYNIENTYKRESRFIDYVRKNSSINIIYPYEELINHKPLYQMYYQFDTHWNRAGSFVGVQALYQALGLPTTDITELSVAGVSRGVGDLINLGGLDTSMADSEHEYNILYHEEIALTFYEGDGVGENPLRTEAPGAINDCNFVLLGDSFRINMVPYVERDFKKCTFAHVNHLDDISIHPDILDADILVIEIVERNDVLLSDALSVLIQLYNDET